MLGIAVVTRDGMDASRARMLWRACVAWSPILLGAVLLASLAPLGNLPAAITVVAVLIVGTIAYSAGLPERSLQDRLAGTWLVPR